jgi:hypothetical protein
LASHRLCKALFCNNPSHDDHAKNTAWNGSIALPVAETQQRNRSQCRESNCQHRYKTWLAKAHPDQIEAISLPRQLIARECDTEPPESSP